jgi:hypothetical protein
MGALGLLVGWLALPLVGLVVGSTGAWGSVLAASVEKTGQAVNFREPSAAFTQLLPGMSPAGR